MGSTYDTQHPMPSEEMQETPMYVDTRVKAGDRGTIGYTASKTTIPSALETQHALIENVFDEVSRLEERLRPFLGNYPTASAEDINKKETDPSLSPTLDSMTNANSKLERITRLINGIGSRIDS